MQVHAVAGQKLAALSPGLVCLERNHHCLQSRYCSSARQAIRPAMHANTFVMCFAMLCTPLGNHMCKRKPHSRAALCFVALPYILNARWEPPIKANIDCTGMALLTFFVPGVYKPGRLNRFGTQELSSTFDILTSTTHSDACVDMCHT